MMFETISMDFCLPDFSDLQLSLLCSSLKGAVLEQRLEALSGENHTN